MAQEVFVGYCELAPDHGITYTRVHLNRMMDKGQFPCSVKLSANRIAWRLSEIEKWKASRPAGRRVRELADAAA